MDYSILVADDDDEDFILLTDFIKHCHQNVTLTHASNGIEATQLLTQGLQPNLILIDAQMPLMDGCELLMWLMKSESWQYIPVVIWTGSLQEPNTKRYYQAGANAVMLKEDVLRDIDTFCHHWFRLVQLP